MRASPSIVHDPDDVDICLVLSDFGALGRAWPEVDEGRTDRETVIRELLEGQYADPVRVVAFNTAEGWSRDVSENIANELGRRISIAGDELLPSLEDFPRSTRRPAGAAATALQCFDREHGLHGLTDSKPSDTAAASRS